MLKKILFQFFKTMKHNKNGNLPKDEAFWQVFSVIQALSSSYGPHP